MSAVCLRVEMEKQIEGAREGVIKENRKREQGRGGEERDTQEEALITATRSMMMGRVSLGLHETGPRRLY